MGQVLGHIGKSGLAPNVEELAKACRSGSLPVTPDTETALRRASADIQSIKMMLMRALGVGTGTRP